jgi:hypothetical protein
LKQAKLSAVFDGSAPMKLAMKPPAAASAGAAATQADNAARPIHPIPRMRPSSASREPYGPLILPGVGGSRNRDA